MGKIVSLTEKVTLFRQRALALLVVSQVPETEYTVTPPPTSALR